MDSRNREKETDDIFAREIVSNINDAKKRIEEIERAILEETPYDLLICDMHFDFYGELRGDAGERTMKFLREKGIEIPIVFCSSQNYKVPGAYDNIYFSERANWEDDIRRVVRSL